jgi:hypothetical protein
LILPDDIAEQTVALKDQYFDLKGLSAYSSLKVPTLRDHMREDDLPYFKPKGKVLIKKSDFDKWMDRFRVNRERQLKAVVDGVVDRLKKR